MKEGLRIHLEAVEGITTHRVAKKILRRHLHFQCPPLESFRVEHAFSFNDYEVARGGQYTRRGGRQLRTVTFDTLFVDWGDKGPSYATHNVGKNFEDVIDDLEKLHNSGSPFRIVATHRGPVIRRGAGPGGGPGRHKVRERRTRELNMIATMRSLSVEERAGEGDTKYLSLSVTEYRDPVVRRKGKGGWPKDHYLGDGDTLRNLARKYYKDPTDWRQIAERNSITKIGPSDELIEGKRFEAGDKLVIPDPNRGERAGRKAGRIVGQAFAEDDD